MESNYNTTTQKEYFVKLLINTCNYKPVPFESNDIDTRLHWLNEEQPDKKKNIAMK